MSQDETRPLLGTENDRTNDSGGGFRARIPDLWATVRHSPVAAIIPVALAARLSVQLPQTTVIYIIQQIVCRQWYEINDPQKIPAGGAMPDELCAAKGPQEWYTIVVTVTGIAAGLGSIIGYQAINYIASRYGRKPAMLGVITMSMAANLFLVTSRYMNSVMEVVWLILWLLTDALSNTFLMTFLVNLYIIDLVSAEARSIMLSTMNGLATIGDTISFTAGGNITTYTHEVLLVFYISVSLDALACFYVLFILPESFTKDKRDELQRERAEETSQHVAEMSHLPRRKRIVKRLASYVGPFKILKPTLNERRGRRNWRLLISSAHIFTASLGSGYSGFAMVIFLTSKYNYKPADVRPVPYVLQKDV
ncbi:hypothetical protein PQX77_002414 [Marasmius sp. AFHP31]|nr:hypothetical protein PQX77_002414 [Marasmius sp. AFHP31]